MPDRRRELPSVDRLLREPGVAAMLAEVPRPRCCVRYGRPSRQPRVRRAGPPDDWTGEIRERLAARASAPSLRPVLNATGVVLHTNLGRAPLARRPPP